MLKHSRSTASFYLRNIFAVIFTLVVAIFLLYSAIYESSLLVNGTTILIIGLLGGFIPIFIEFVTALRSGKIFIRDKAQIATRLARNKRQVQMFFWPASAFGIILIRFPGAIKVALLSMGAGYLLPYSIVLTVHFIKNHKEIRKVTEGLM